MVDEIANMVSVNKAAELTGYSATYIRKLAREGTLQATQWGRAWMIDKTELLAFKNKMDNMGTEKHNPWRGDLGEKGRN